MQSSTAGAGAWSGPGMVAIGDPIRARVSVTNISYVGLIATVVGTVTNGVASTALMTPALVAGVVSNGAGTFSVVVTLPGLEPKSQLLTINLQGARRPITVPVPLTFP